jgi:hypothetical protein
MKIKLLLFCLCAAYVSCSSTPRIDVRLEPFSRAKIANLDLRHLVSQGKVENSRAKYERTISEKQTSPLSVAFEITFKADRNYTSMLLLDETAQIRIDDSVYKIKLLDQKVSKNRTCGGFGIIVCTTKYTVTEKAVLTKEMEKKMLNAKSLMYQFKTTETVVMEAAPAQLNAIKELLSMTNASLK